MAELFFVGVILALLYLTVRAGALFVRALGGRRFRAYSSLARRYRGKYENRGFNEPPTVSFDYNGSLVRVGLAPVMPGQSMPPRTRVVARFSKGIPFRMELAPVARSLPPQPPRGTRPVRIGINEFDQRFHVQANDPEMARDFLAPPVRDAIGRLVRMSPVGGMLVSINPERILVQVDRNLGQSADALIAAVHEAMKIHDGLAVGVASRLRQGVEIVEVGTVPVEESGPPICKVCGQTVEAGPRMLCVVCRVPYHQDCWEFIGSCSVFGCTGKMGVPG
ncbi:MAG: hypothetical protein SFX72_22930 [Isosphaeraceae bacterium]|nr:hypothetical protein [Isosphaeraceae bacterium]